MAVRWGILSTAGIGTRHVIPALQRGRHTTVGAIASRDRAKAEAVAAQFGIGRFHGSYDDLLADRDVDAVYIPLPNNLHLPWSQDSHGAWYATGLMIASTVVILIYFRRKGWF